MDRRRFLLTSLAGAFAGPLAAEAQQPAGSAPRIGVLLFMPLTPNAQEDFRLGLREHGYVDGRNIIVEWRSAEGRVDRANTLAGELVRLGVNVIVAEFTPAGQAAKRATQTIPIILASAGDPVTTGWWRASRGPAATSPGSQTSRPSSPGSEWSSYGRSSLASHGWGS